MFTFIVNFGIFIILKDEFNVLHSSEMFRPLDKTLIVSEFCLEKRLFFCVEIPNNTWCDKLNVDTIKIFYRS